MKSKTHQTDKRAPAQTEHVQPSVNDSEIIHLLPEQHQLLLGGEGDEETLQRIRSEAVRLANQAELERAFWLPKRASEMGVPLATLKSAVNVVLRKRADEQKERQQEERARARLEKEHERKAEKQQRKAEKEAERQKRKEEKEAEHKQKQKTKALAALAGMPVARQQAGLERLAEQLGEDAAVLQRELTDLVGDGELSGAPTLEETDPWPRPVKTAAVLQEVHNKIAKHIAMQPHQLTAAALWAAHAWLYDHEVLTHSPILAFTSAEADSGKSTTADVVGYATPRHMLSVEITGPSLFRMVDQTKPTLIIDEADDLFERKRDLKHVINSGWTRGAKIPRTAKIGGALVTVYFDVFTPKVIALLGRKLPQTTRTRSIEIRMLPKARNEKVTAFNHTDDAEFAMLRRKLARWARDNAAALKAAKPAMPSSMNNRTAANWKLLFAIADLAGAAWAKKARTAAEQLSRSGRRPSDGVELLKIFQQIFAKQEQIGSEEVVEQLLSDPTSTWVDCNHGGAVSQRLVAVLLDAYDIKPNLLPLKGGPRQRGYRREQFTDAFARYLPKQVFKCAPRKSRKKSK